MRMVMAKSVLCVSACRTSVYAHAVVTICGATSPVLTLSLSG